MNKIYSPINWENYPSGNTPINEDNLNKMDIAINELDNRVISQDTIKANKADLSNLIKEWVIDEATGVITLTKYNGEQVIFDLNIEKIPVSFYLDGDGILYMTTDDGTTFSANIGSMIPVLTFNPSDTIAVSVSGSGVNKTYSFSIKTASVTEDMLQPNFLADIRTEANKAELSESNAKTYATQSQSYAVGGTGLRDGENSDNAKYYKEQAQSMYNDLAKGQVLGVKGNNETAYRTGNVNLTADNIGATAHIDLTGQLQTSSYRRSVIALCKTTTSNVGVNSSSNGQFTFRSEGGSQYTKATADVYVSSDYYYDQGINANLIVHARSNVEIIPCTFVYNGVNYGGIEVFISDNASNNIVFDGSTNFNIFGLDYYNINTKEVLNEEVYNSLSYDNVVWLNNNTLNGKQIATEEDITEATSKIQTTVQSVLPSTGWYRVAEFEGTSLSIVKGSVANSCELSIKRSHSNTNNEFHHLKLVSISGTQSIYSIASKSNVQIITKARYTINATDLKAYLEIYYNSDIKNICYFEISSPNSREACWKAITPTLTEETVDGVTVTTAYDIPANLTPASNLDLSAVQNGLLEVNGKGSGLSTSVLAKALELGYGVYNYSLSGSSYTGDDLPHRIYRYGSATILKRATNAITVIVWGLATAESYPPQINYWLQTSEGGWSGWKTFATTEDLAKIGTSSSLYSGTTELTADTATTLTLSDSLNNYRSLDICVKLQTRYTVLNFNLSTLITLATASGVRKHLYVSDEYAGYVEVKYLSEKSISVLLHYTGVLNDFIILGIK